MMVLGKGKIGKSAFFLVVLLLAGCGQEADSNLDAQIELLEPPVTELSFETAIRRNLYDADVYSAVVCPQIQEYGLEDGIRFEGYDALCGDEVQKGSLILHGDEENVDEKIEKLEEAIQEMEDSYREFLEEYSEKIAEPKAGTEHLEERLDELEANWQEEYIETVDSKGNVIQAKNSQYDAWYAEYEDCRRTYSIYLQNYNELNETMRQRRELYELDHAYQLSQLGYLKEERERLKLLAGMEGIIVGEKELDAGEAAKGGKALAAIGSAKEKELKCEFVEPEVIQNAEDVYAIIQGERHEVDYEVMDSAEYTRLKNENKKIYSTFHVVEDASEIPMGSYAAVVIVNKTVKDALTISASSIKRDGTANYVYVLDEEGRRNYTVVKTGMSEGYLTEILSGLNEGDKVLTESSLTAKAGDQTVAMGSVSRKFNGNGYAYYPCSQWVENPVTHGTVRLEECLVKENQKVEKGEVLARVKVEPDGMVLEEKQKKLQRERERLADLRAAGEEENKKAIETKEKSIGELETAINEMQADYQVTEITAPVGGIVSRMAELKDGEEIKGGEGMFLLSDVEKSLVRVPDEKGQLAYGNKVTLTFTETDGGKRNVDGMVVTASKMALSSDLSQDYALIQVGDEGWPPAANGHIEVNALVTSMENVLVVPKSAVETYAGSTYVKVRLQSGEIVYQNFIAGGQDLSYYWVAEGLTEGMKICFE